MSEADAIEIHGAGREPARRLPALLRHAGLHRQPALGRVLLLPPAARPEDHRLGAAQRRGQPRRHLRLHRRGLAVRAGSPIGAARSPAGATPGRRLYPMLADDDAMPPDDGATGAIFCFVVAPGERRRSIARAAAGHACDGLRAACGACSLPVRDAAARRQPHQAARALESGFTILGEGRGARATFRRAVPGLRWSRLAPA